MVKEAIDTTMVLQPEYNIIVSGQGNCMVEGDRYRMMDVVTTFATALNTLMAVKMYCLLLSREKAMLHFR